MEDPTVIPAPPIIVKYCPHNFSIESHIFFWIPSQNSSLRSWITCAWFASDDM